KDDLPSTGQAAFCFVLVAVLHWITTTGVSKRLGQLQPALTALSVCYVAILGVPLFMAVMLTKQPTRALRIYGAGGWTWLAAPLLAGLLVVFGAVVMFAILQHPLIRESLQASEPAFRDGGSSRSTSRSLSAAVIVPMLILALTQALCEEFAFRGFIL